jgi:arsenate reductase (thioredoxin)
MHIDLRECDDCSPDQTDTVGFRRPVDAGADSCRDASGHCISGAGYLELKLEEVSMSDKPTILFVCVHNAGRSQMAAGYMRSLSGGAVHVFSGGSEPVETINPVAVQAMAEDGIDITGTVPQLLRTEQVKDADVVITMGCGDACPIFPGKRYEDWELTDPAGLPLEQVRPSRDEIKTRIRALLTEILPGSATVQSQL